MAEALVAFLLLKVGDNFKEAVVPFSELDELLLEQAARLMVARTAIADNASFFLSIYVSPLINS